MSNKSILTNMLCCLNDWTRSIGNGCCVDAIYLEYSEAFAKIEHIGIREKLLYWITSFLEDRKYSLKIDSSYDDFVEYLRALSSDL